MTKATVTYLQLSANMLDSEVRINDIPVAETSAAKTVNASVPIVEYLVPGNNLIQLRIGNPSSDGEFAVEDGADVVVRVAEFADGDWLDDDGGRQLARLSPSVPHPTARPFSVDAPFSSTLERRWAWSVAPAFSSDAVKTQLDQFVMDTAGLFAARDIDGLVRLSSGVLQEDSEAYPGIPLPFRTQDFTSMLAGPSLWQPRQVDPLALQYRPIANGRMVEVLDAEGRPPIRTLAADDDDPWNDDNYCELPLRLGVWRGRVTILR